MLVLTRKNRDTIRIGNNVTVTILRVKGNTVRVGIEAPREVRVMRGELPDDFTDEAETELDSHEESEVSGLPLGRHQNRVRERREMAVVETVLTPEMMAQYCA